MPDSTRPFDAAVEQYHRALGEFVLGDATPLKSAYSHEEDVTVANPFGPPARGWSKVAETMERAATLYKGGAPTGFELIARLVTADLAYLVEIERYHAKLAGSDDAVPISLRVTTVFRPEDGTWKVVHRHADPITTPRGPESIRQSGSSPAHQRSGS